MEDGGTVKRKTRNALRKKAAGEKRRFQDGEVSPQQDLYVLVMVMGEQQSTALAHTGDWGPLKGADFGSSDAAWPPRTPYGH